MIKLGRAFFPLVLCMAQNPGHGALIPPRRQTKLVREVPRCARFEAAFRLPGSDGNPFDPADNDVQVVFDGPGGRATRIPAFWDGDGLWKVRFAPIKPGRYTLTVERNGRKERARNLTPSSFLCVPSNRPGFVRRVARGGQRFAFDNGETYYPFGCNQAWTSSRLPGYPEMFRKMNAAGMNWARVWMTFWDDKALEWASNKANSPPPGTLLLGAARRWDEIFDAAEKNGVYVQMVLQHHGQYTTRTDPNWGQNPYNLANGGFLQEPQDFFTNERATALTRAKYRYILARWGYSDHLMAWELFNEVQNIGEVRGRFADVIAWHRQMAAYLRTLDTNHHLVTTSNSPPGSALREGVALDFDQAHSYVSDIITLFTSLDATGLRRPLFWGEWGHADGNNGSDAQSESFLHDGLWSGVMTPLPGGPQFWYWDRIEKNDWWAQFRSVSSYLRAAKVAARPALKKTMAQIVTESRGDLSFAPPRGWEPTRVFAITVSPENGAAPGLEGISHFIQGRSHRVMTKEPIVFSLAYPRAGQFLLHIEDIAKAGAHPQISLDGKVVAEEEYAPAETDRKHAAKILTLAVPPGRHKVGVWNTGSDWFTVGRIVLTNFVPALGVAAKRDGQSVFFWVYRRTRADEGAARSGAKPVSGTIRFTGLAAGAYSVTLWDTAAGARLGPPRAVRAVNGVLTVTLSNLAADVAGWAGKTGGHKGTARAAL